MSERKIAICAGCQNTKPIQARGLCSKCYQRRPERVAQRKLHKAEPAVRAKLKVQSQTPEAIARRKERREEPEQAARRLTVYNLAKNKVARSIRNAAFVAANRAFLHAAKDKPCMDCGGSFPPVCMDFDHRPGTYKRFSVGQTVTRNRLTMELEIAKCDVVCANCHRIRTHDRWLASGGSDE